VGSGNGSAGQQNGYWADSFEPSTDWFAPVNAEQQTSVGLLERPGGESDLEVTADHGFAPITDQAPNFPPGALEITPDDVLEALGPQADEMLATADIDVDELIRLINAETVVLPPLVLPEDVPETDAEGNPAPEMVEAITSWKQRFLKGAVAAVLVTLAGSGGAAAAMDKSVTVEVDGKEKQVNTYDSTVAEVLEDQGIKIGPHDAVSPSPQAKVGQDDKITLDKGRLLKVNVDGEHREQWVRSDSVGEALKQLGIPSQGAWLSAAPGTALPDQGMDLTVKTAKDITITDGSGKPKPVTTTAVTVDELVKEQNLKLGPEDHITPSKDGKIVPGAQIRIDRTGSSVVNVTVPVDPPVREIVDNSMFKGEEKVEKQGTPGEKIVFTRVTTKNGDETDRESIGEKITKQAEETVVRVGGKEPPNSAVWDKLVECEAGGNWAMDSGNGYYGGLQFDKSTWDAYGGSQYAAYPHQASREQQIAVATKVRDARGGGYGAWPSCSSKLGLE